MFSMFREVRFRLTNSSPELYLAGRLALSGCSRGCAPIGWMLLSRRENRCYFRSSSPLQRSGRASGNARTTVAELGSLPDINFEIIL